MHISTVRNPESLVPPRITPLRLEAFEQLPKHARRCVFWEVDPSTLQSATGWRPPVGPRVREGSLAVDGHARVGIVRADGGAVSRVDGSTTRLPTGDEPCLGYAFYAPPRAVPRARHFPSGPVSADAVLLTSLGVESSGRCRGAVAQPDRRGRRRSRPPRRPGTGGVRTYRRGVRSGRSAGGVAGSAPDHRGTGGLLGGPVRARRRPAAGRRLRRGRRQHPYFPRLRLELEQGLGWKADVEAALERLLETAQLQQPVGAGASPASGRAGQLGLTRPACSTESSWASSSAKVNVPVGRSFLPSRYSRLTAARMPSAIESRV